MRYPILNLVGFQLGWLGCVAGAGFGFAWPGTVAAVALLALHLWWVEGRRSEINLILLVVSIGVLIDSFLGLVGLFRFSAPWPVEWVAPPWLIGVWLLFAATLRHGLGWLARRPWLATGFGALGGPLAYLAGERLGAATFPHGYGTTLGLLAVVWGLWMLALTVLVPRPAGREETTTSVAAHSRD